MCLIGKRPSYLVTNRVLLVNEHHIYLPPAFQAEMALNEGQNLLDQMSLPIKNAFGQDVTPDNRQNVEHVKTLLDGIHQRKARCEELAGVRKLQLQQVLQLRICDRDAEQVIPPTPTCTRGKK